MKMKADRPATHDMPATSYSHSPSNESPSNALRASLSNVQSLLDENAPARTVKNTPEGTQQNNYHAAALPSSSDSKLDAVLKQLKQMADDVSAITRDIVQSRQHNSGQGITL